MLDFREELKQEIIRIRDSHDTWAESVKLEFILFKCMSSNQKHTLVKAYNINLIYNDSKGEQKEMPVQGPHFSSLIHNKIPTDQLSQLIELILSEERTNFITLLNKNAKEIRSTFEVLFKLHGYLIRAYPITIIFQMLQDITNCGFVPNSYSPKNSHYSTIWATYCVIESIFGRLNDRTFIESLQNDTVANIRYKLLPKIFNINDEHTSQFRKETPSENPSVILTTQSYIEIRDCSGSTPTKFTLNKDMARQLTALTLKIDISKVSDRIKEAQKEIASGIKPRHTFPLETKKIIKNLFLDNI